MEHCGDSKTGLLVAQFSNDDTIWKLDNMSVFKWLGLKCKTKDVYDVDFGSHLVFTIQNPD